MTDKPVTIPDEGELLTPDEDAARKPRWMEKRDLDQTLIGIAKLHHPNLELAIDEEESYYDERDDLKKLIQGLNQAAYDRGYEDGRGSDGRLETTGDGY